MTNYEKLTSLPEEEMAWFLMAYAETCRVCVYKGSDEDGYCGRGDKAKDNCIGGVRKWVMRESTKDDEKIFAMCKNNVIVERWNSMTPEERNGMTCHVENGFVAGIVPIGEVENPF
jgi:hypothetical protein